MVSSTATFARLVITLTVTAITPLSLPTVFSIRKAQFAHDMPNIKGKVVMILI